MSLWHSCCHAFFYSRGSCRKWNYLLNFSIPFYPSEFASSPGGAKHRTASGTCVRQNVKDAQLRRGCGHLHCEALGQTILSQYVPTRLLTQLFCWSPVGEPSPREGNPRPCLAVPNAIFCLKNTAGLSKSTYEWNCQAEVEANLKRSFSTSSQYVFLNFL